MSDINSNRELNIHSSPHVRAVLIVLGTMCLLVGLVGVILPMLPTTPFLLLAAICYARSSDRFYNGLMNNRVFGPPLREWRDNHSVSKKNKTVAVGVVIVSFAATIIFAAPNNTVRGVLVVMALVLIAIIVRLPSRAGTT